MDSGPLHFGNFGSHSEHHPEANLLHRGSLIPVLQQPNGDGLEVEWLALEVNDKGRKAAITVPGKSACSSNAPS